MGFKIVVVDSLEELRKAAKDATAKVRDRALKTSEAMSPLETSLRSIWEKADFSSYSKAVGEILTVVVKAVDKKDVEFLPKGNKFSKLEVVVPTANNNSHSYPLGRPTLMYGTTSGIRGDGTSGNNMGEQWRYATDAEIDELFDGFPESRESSILGSF